jgi:hypothetical protein
MTFDDYNSYITKHGYKVSVETEYYSSYIKESLSKIYCSLNNKPPKIELMFYNLCNFEIKLTAETKNGNVIKMSFNSLNFKDIENKLGEYEFRLVKAWESVNF